jgi:1-acyl-sn-glycerol-3-phosphate acyltransferase
MWYDAWTPLRLLLRLALIPLVLLALVPTLLSINSLGRQLHVGAVSLEEFMIARWSSWLCRVFGVRVRARGEVLPGPVLIVANHVSWLDIQAMHSVTTMSFVGKAEIRRWPLLGHLARAGGTIFIERGNHASSADVCEALVQRLNDGGRVAIFPEGGIRPGEGVKVFHARLFKAAVEADCMVQPTMIRYLHDGKPDPDMTFINGENLVLNMLRLLGRPTCDADLRFLEPFDPDERARRDLARQAQAAVTEAYHGD